MTRMAGARRAGHENLIGMGKGRYSAKNKMLLENKAC